MITRRIGSATAALALLGTCLAATPAVAADDTAALTMDAKLVKALNKGKVKTSAAKPATFKASTFTFPSALQGGSAALSGGMSMKKGKNSVKISKIVINAEDGTLDAEVGIKTKASPAPMAFMITGLMLVSGGTNQLLEEGTWTGAKVKLAKSVTVTGNKWDPAKLLGDALGVKLKSGANFGKVDISVAP